MNNPTTDFNEWLDSLGFDASSSETNTQAEQSAIANGDLPPEPLAMEVANHLPDRVTNVPLVHEDIPTPEIQSVSFSEEDMDSLLAENGFAEPQHDEAEEVSSSPSASGFTPEEESEEEEEEDNTEEYNDNTVEGGDLDAEEDADWQEAIDSGGVVPVSLHNAAQIMANTNEDILEDLEATVPSDSPEGSAPLLPENSPTVSIDDSTSRFSGTEWYDEVTNKIIMIAGCGGIGSNLAYQIARLKPSSIVLYDDDTVELANMSGQLFKRSDIGNKKVSAVHNMICQYTNMYNVRAVSQRFTNSTYPTDIMMCGFDSMNARKTYYHAWKKHLITIPQEHCKDCLFMDGRLTIDTFQVFCLTGEDTYNMERYEREFLFDDSQADSEVCSQKQTTYLACMIGSIMTNLFINWVANSLDPIIPYKLPFFTQYEAQHMIFKTEE